MIEAAKNLRKEYPHFHFLFLGRGEDEKMFKELAKGSQNITFEGFVDNVNDYIAAFDLFVFPSRHEGLGSILFDVMQLQVPIVATKVGGIVDIIHHNHNGILIEPCSSKAIEESIVTLYNNKKLREKLTNNAMQSLENFSAKKMAQKYQKIYEENRCTHPQEISKRS